MMFGSYEEPLTARQVINPNSESGSTIQYRSSARNVGNQKRFRTVYQFFFYRERGPCSKSISFPLQVHHFTLGNILVSRNFIRSSQTTPLHSNLYENRFCSVFGYFLIQRASSSHPAIPTVRADPKKCITRVPALLSLCIEFHGLG